MTPFSVIVFGVVVWTIAVSGAKQLRFRLKTNKCGGGQSNRLKSADPEYLKVLFARVSVKQNEIK